EVEVGHLGGYLVDPDAVASAVVDGLHADAGYLLVRRGELPACHHLAVVRVDLLEQSGVGHGQQASVDVVQGNDRHGDGQGDPESGQADAVDVRTLCAEHPCVVTDDSQAHQGAGVVTDDSAGTYGFHRDRVEEGHGRVQRPEHRVAVPVEHAP